MSLDAAVETPVDDNATASSGQADTTAAEKPPEGASDEFGAGILDAATAPAEPPPPTLAAQLADLGFSDVKDDAEAQNRLIESYRQLQQQQEEYQRRFDEIMPLAQYGRQFLAQQTFQPAGHSQQVSPAQTPEQRKHWWGAPQVDLNTVARYRERRTDAEGNEYLGWKDNAPAEIRAAFEQYESYTDKWAADLTYKPHEVLPQVVQHELVEALRSKNPEVVQLLRSVLNETLTETRQKETEEQFWSRLESEHGQQLWQVDARTGRFFEQNGERRFTAEGQAKNDYMVEAAGFGITDPARQWQYACDKYDAERFRSGAQQQSVAQQTQQTIADQRVAHLQRGAAATSVPDRSGSFPEARNGRQNRHASPGQVLAERLRADGAIFDAGA